MKIKTIHAYRKNLSLQKPYTIAYKTITNVENIFLEIELENGICGRGAANPDPDVVDETLDEVLENLQSEMLRFLIGKDIRQYAALLDFCEQHYSAQPGTLAAIDMALHDAFGQFLGIPIVDLYGQKHHSLPTSVTIGIKNVAETIKEAAEYAQQGFRILKIKTGGHVEEDIERLIKLYEVYSNNLVIRVDANQGYTLSDLRHFSNETQHIPIELIEQPLPVGQEQELLTLPTAQRKRLAADESLKNTELALYFSQLPQPFGIFNCKLMKCGGIRNAFKISTIASLASIDMFWGCNDESQVSIAAALHAAFASPTTRYLDLDGSFDLAEDIVRQGFILSEGNLQLTGLPGLGLVI